MQYIKKAEVAPADWERWFTTREATPRRSYDYAKDYDILTSPQEALAFLIQEQVGLCAYCQSEINPQTASIEHVIPKSYAPEISTNYHNLVAVCKGPTKDPATGKSHCDKERENSLIPSIIFYKNASIYADKSKKQWKKNRFFSAKEDGSIAIAVELWDNRYPNHRNVVGDQANAFIEVLNLNHANLVSTRKGIIQELLTRLPSDNRSKLDYFKARFESYYLDRLRPNREFVLIYLFTKIAQKDPNWLSSFLGPIE